MDLANELTRNWWTIALRGAVAVLFGIVAFAWPGITLLALVFLFGAYAIIDGGFAVAVAMRVRQFMPNWWAILLEGLLGIAAGVVAFAWPGVTALALLYIIAFWAIFTGILEVVAAVRLREAVSDAWLLGLGGAASILFGVVAAAQPGAGALAIVWVLGLYAVIFGVALIALGFRIRSLGQTHAGQRVATA